jgi:hypothetical protein
MCNKYIKTLTVRPCPLLADLLTKEFAITPGHISLFSAGVKYDEKFLKDSQIGHVS